MDFPHKLTTIANGESLSAAVDVLGYEVVAIEQPANCEGTVFTFQGSVDGVVFANIRDATAELSIAKSATAAEVIQFGRTASLRGYKFIKVRTGTAASPTNQTGAATLKISLIPQR